MLTTLLALCMTFDVSQRTALTQAYEYGVPHDLGFTLAAIAWKESSAGKYRLNLDSKDLGLFQINEKTAYNTLGVTNHYHQVQLAQELIYNDHLGAYLAIETLEHFRAERPLTNQVYREMLMSYNTGYSWRRSPEKKRRALAYSEDVRSKVSTLMKCQDSWLEK
jgi:hypothetical protein